MDILCHDCGAKAGKLLDERKAYRLFDIHIEEYGFCPKCTAEINATFEELAKAEFGMKSPDTTLLPPFNLPRQLGVLPRVFQK